MYDGIPRFVHRHYKFTGKERDTNSGNDYFGARYYGNVTGRFMSPDPSGLTFADPTNPQSFNLYSYVLDNPLTHLDPTGMDCTGTEATGNSQSVESADGPQTAISSTPPPACSDPAACPPGTIQGGDGKCYFPPVIHFDLNSFALLSRGSGDNSSIPRAPSNPVPANPCTESGNAPDPHFYQQRGLNARNNPLTSSQDLAQFPRGGDLDAQPNGASRAYGNYVYGVYMRAAGFPLFIATAGARWYASTSNAQYGPADGTMSGSVPSANVTNITNGYNAQKNGTVCHVIP
jgi:RHS repeat-associated protein